MRRFSVLSQDERDAIENTYAALATKLGKFKERPQQRALVNFVAQVASEEKIGVAEAPTAVGKSFGYLVPAAVLAVLKGTPVVVSTGTVVLQNQLAQKDLPLVAAAVEAATGKVLRFATLKGRSRFVCPVKLLESGRQTDMFVEDDVSAQASTLASRFLDGSWHGDIDTVPVALNARQWSKINNETRSCAGKSCPRYAQCPYFTSVEDARAAHVVVTNHDMFFKATASGEARAGLPELDAMIAIFDEAHQLPEKALNAFAEHFDSDVSWLAEASALAQSVDTAMADTLQRDIRSLERKLNALFVAVDAFAGDDTIARISRTRPLSKAITSKVDDLLQVIEAVRVDLEFLFDPILLDKIGMKRGMMLRAQGFTRRAKEMGQACQQFFDEDQKPLHARWFERSHRRWTGYVSPFASGKILADRLWDKVGAAIAVSATLSTGDDMRSMLRKFGLTRNERRLTLTLDSPLDYSKSRIIVPNVKAAPGDTAEHTNEITHYLSRFDYSRGGVLTLFTSRKQMTAVFETLPERVRAFTLLQGSDAPQALLDKHRARTKNSFPSMLFGLQSFGEGLDLPGEQCVAVIIARIPFPQANEPILAAASEWLTDNGREPFSTLMLPAANITMRQNVGRLVRQEGDYGDVVILDNRIRTKRYGRSLLNSLPMGVHFEPRA
jgi:ATP-dependent DNA helicase DinG